MFAIAVNRNSRGKLAPDAGAAAYAALNDGFTNELLDVDGIAEAIRAGHAITAWHDGRRKVANFRLAQHVGIDFDGGDMPLDVLARHPIIAQHAALLHTTASHTAEHPRSRALFVLDRPIYAPGKLVELVSAMLDTFGTADPHCSDAARLFYGAPGCETISLGNVLSLDDAARLFVLPHRQRVATAQVITSHDAGRPVAVGDVPSAKLQQHAQMLLDMVRHAPNGQKHAVLRDIARTFGGYVVSGYYARADAEAWLRAAIETRRADVRNMSAAYATIAQGLEYGARHPLTFTDRQPRRPDAAANTASTNWYTAAPRSVGWMTQETTA